MFNLLFPKTVYSTYDNGNFLSVVDNGSAFIFKFNSIVYSKLPKKEVFTHQYWDYFLPSAYAAYDVSKGEKEKILIIGLGGGTLVHLLSHTSIKTEIDAVELSSKVAEIAKRFLPKEDIANTNIIIEDGFDYLSSVSSASYNAVFLDAYYKDKIPQQFLTPEFVSLAAKALKYKGILAVNFAMTFMGSVAYEKYTNLLKQKFNVYYANTGITEGNIILVCAKDMQKNEIVEKIKNRMEYNKDTALLIRSYENMKEA